LNEIKKLLIDFGLSKKQLSIEAKVGYSHLTNVLSGHRKMTIKTFKKIIKVLKSKPISNGFYKDIQKIELEFLNKKELKK
jgi:predicted transcriptional regulator